MANWKTAINEAMNAENRNIGNFPVYSEKVITIAQQRQIGYVLELLAKNRQGQMDELQGLLLQKAKEVFGNCVTASKS